MEKEKEKKTERARDAPNKGEALTMRGGRHKGKKSENEQKYFISYFDFPNESEVRTGFLISCFIKKKNDLHGT